MTEASSGVWHNTSDKAITLNVEGKYGCSAIITANGVVIEGRDGANSRLVNELNPVRASSSQTKMTIDGESVDVHSAFAKNLVIPAGGYAIIIQAGFAGTTTDTDGRGFMNWNVIGTYGNVVRLLWVDTQEVITPYVDQKPTVSGNTKLLVQMQTENYDIEAEVVKGIVAMDDNGTFDPSDDVNISSSIVVVDQGGFDVNKEGVYVVKLSVTDANGNKTEFTREVEVKAEGFGKVKVGEKEMLVLIEKVAIDKEVTQIGNLAFIVYTYEYAKANQISIANGHGEAFVVDKYGKVVRIYDGANGKYYDATIPEGVSDGEKCPATAYIKAAIDSLKEGETVIIAPHTTANSATGGSRAFLLGARAGGIGAQVEFLDLVFQTMTYTFTLGDKSYTAEESKVLYNTEVTDKTAAKYSMIIYNKNYTGTFTTNTHGAVLVVDKYGKLVKIYDGANLQFWTNGAKATGTLTFNASNYATVAFSELADGETMVIFPNDGGTNEARKFALGFRNLTEASTNYFGMIASITGFTFEKDEKVFAIGDKTFTTESAKVIYNTEVTDKTAAKYSMIIYDKNYTGTFTTNTHGAVLVVDRYGKLVKIYDGANLQFWTDGAKATGTLTFNANNYATVAFSELADGETMIIFPNDGGTNEARKFALGLRNLTETSTNYFGMDVSITGIVFADEPKETVKISIGENSVELKPEKIAINVTTADVNAYDAYIFTTEYSGVLNFVNGWGEAFVMDKDGKIVRIYDGISGKLYDAENPAGVALANADYLTKALASLKANEWLLVGANDSTKTMRGFLSSNRTLGATVALDTTLFTVSEKAGATVTVNGKTFYGATVSVNAEAVAKNVDFAIYTYGYNGIVTKAGWSEVFVIDSEGTIVRIYDGVNHKYYDADNSAGVTGKDFYDNSATTLEAFKALKVGETMIVGFNGGKNNMAGRAFLVANRAFGKKITVENAADFSPATETVNYATVVVGGRTFYVDATKVLLNADYGTAVPAFAIYDYGFTGNYYKGGWGVAFVVDKATGKIVKVFDGTSGKYWDKDNDGVVNKELCDASKYAEQAFAALEEGQYVIVAPNSGTQGNIARKLFLDNRKLDTVVTYTYPTTTEPQA